MWLIELMGLVTIIIVLVGLGWHMSESMNDSETIRLERQTARKISDTVKYE